MLAITVNIPVDEQDGLITGGDDISLRDAILEAPDGETINFAPSLNGATITLNRALNHISFGKNLTIDASMLSAGITVDANDPSPTQPTGTGTRIFNITDPIPGINAPLVTLIGLKLTGGDVTGDGGAINSAARLVLQKCIVDSNEATGNGGGIFSSAGAGSSLRVEESTISGNISTITGGGGGISVLLYNSASLVIEKSTVSGNTTNGDGGGVFAKANLDTYNPVPTPQVITISRSLVSGNTALNRGGGIYTRNLARTETLVEESRITGNHVPASSSMRI